MRSRPSAATVRIVEGPGILFGRVRRVDPRAVDAVIALVLAGASLAAAAGGRHHGPLTLLAGAVTCLTVAWRRRFPIVATSVAVVAITVFTVSGHNTSPPVEPFALLLDYYMVGRLSAERGRPAVDAALLALSVIAIIISPGNPHVGDVAASWALAAGLPFAAGRAISSRAALTRELSANAARLEREQEDRARRAATEERNRIARELHDVIAHSVSVMVIQTQAARRVAAADPETAREALSSVASCGREALIEMRRMIGVLRHGDEELAGATAPSLAQLDALIARAREAGLPVELRVHGEPRALPPGLDLVAFRVVQEALTNSLKHAGPARAVVSVEYAPGVLELEVSDTGRGPAPSNGHVGHGLVGMRERLSLYGGELRAGRARGGGFCVRARIPVTEKVVV